MQLFEQAVLEVVSEFLRTFGSDGSEFHARWRVETNRPARSLCETRRIMRGAERFLKKLGIFIDNTRVACYCRLGLCYNRLVQEEC